MEEKKIFRYIKRLLPLILVVSFVLSGLFYFAMSKKQTYVASAVINYNYKAAEEGKTPIGTTLDVSEIKSSAILAKAIEKMPGVEAAKYGQDVVENLFAITRLMRIFGVALMLLLAGATLFIISNTIRLTVFARRKEIAIMKYVGATDWFIRWPFLLEGIVLGCVGGIIAALVLRSFYAAMAAKIYDTLAFFPLMPQYPFMNYVAIAIILSGMAIGAIGSTISLKRFLKV